MEIVTNKRPRLLLDFDQLTEREQRDFDHDDAETGSYVRYKGKIYSLDEFAVAPENLRKRGWDGVVSDSHFSGVLIRLGEHDDPDRVVMATFCS